VVDALLMRYAILLVVKAKILGFYFIKALYIEYEDFKKVVGFLFDYFTLQEAFMFKENKLCISKSSLRYLIIRKAHGEPWLVTLASTRPLRYS